MAYFTCINHIAALAYLHKPIDDEFVDTASDTIARIKREGLLKDAGLPTGFLAPVEKHWNTVIKSAREGEGNPSKAGHDMNIVIDRLCKRIEAVGG
jgi:hypothetical protein